MPPKSLHSTWVLMIASTIIFAITMGARQSLGLFIAPINLSTGIDIVSISLALAVGQFFWGLTQPIFGAIADKKGSYGVIAFGALLLFSGLALTPFVNSSYMLILTLGVLSAAGAGAGSFSILIGATVKQLPIEKRSFASGFINAGGSFGQFIFAPLSQVIIGSFGWISAMFTLAASTLLTIPLASLLRPKHVTEKPIIIETITNELGLSAQVGQALKNKSYLCLHAGFFTCGFHVAFLVTHLPGEVALCGHTASVSAISLSLIGLFNIAGSLFAGHLGSKYRMKYILAVMYASRTVMIALYLVSPKTPLTFYIFAACLGFTWLATVPPTAGLVGKLFGTKYLATLFGLTLLTHQVGGFLGAWLGGLFMVHDGNYHWMWYLDMFLAAIAALVNLPIKEAKVILKAQV